MPIKNTGLNIAQGLINNICLSQSPGAGAVLLNGSVVSGGVAILDAPRRISINSGGNDSGISWTVTGTSRTGAPLVETIAGANATPIVTTQDFKTVSSITHSGTVATTMTAGGSAVASTEWVDEHQCAGNDSDRCRGLGDRNHQLHGGVLLRPQSTPWFHRAVLDLGWATDG